MIKVYPHTARVSLFKLPKSIKYKIDMCTGSVSMTRENGELARAAIELAQRENWEATMAYVKAVGP
jgi:predicted RNase H-like nuclease